MVLSNVWYVTSHLMMLNGMVRVVVAIARIVSLSAKAAVNLYVSIVTMNLTGAMCAPNVTNAARLSSTENAKHATPN